VLASASASVSLARTPRFPLLGEAKVEYVSIRQHTSAYVSIPEYLLRIEADAAEVVNDSSMYLFKVAHA
jgi:hypothetical protein